MLLAKMFVCGLVGMCPPTENSTNNELSPKPTLSGNLYTTGTGAHLKMCTDRTCREFYPNVHGDYRITNEDLGYELRTENP